jgi:hypothetical protein
VIAIVVLFLWRWLNTLLAGAGNNTIQSSDYYAPGWPQTPYGVVGMYGGPVGFGPWNDPGNYGGWYNGSDYPQAWGRPKVGDPGGSKRW